MKRFMIAMLLLSLGCGRAAADLIRETPGGFQVPGLDFTITHAAPDWRERTPAGEQLGEFRLTRSWKALGDDAFAFSAAVAANSEQPTARLGLNARLPLPEFLGRELLFDGKGHGFPRTFNPKFWRDGSGMKTVSTLVIPLAEGTLTLRGAFRVDSQDNRKFKTQNFGLRILFSNFEGNIRESELKLTISFQPWKSEAVSLAPVANMGYTDEFGNDTKGGWTDQGPENDLRDFPGGKLAVAGIEFDTLKEPGNTVLMFGNKERPTFPREALLPVDGRQARSLYLLHALAWVPKGLVPIGELAITYADGTIKTQPVTTADVGNFWSPNSLPNGGVAWNGENISALTGLYMSRFDLEPKPLKSIAFCSAGRAVWGIVGVTLSDNCVALPRQWPLEVVAGDEWTLLKNKKPVKRGSVLDFSFLCDAPAGKYGMVRNVDGRFEFEKRPGVPIRFYGANVCEGANFPNREEAELMADAFAASGYNLIRFHHFDNPLPLRKDGKSTVFDPDQLDRMDYLLAAMRKRGIYTTIDLYVSRTLEKGELPEFPDKAIKPKEFKDLVFVSENAMKNWEEFSANLLNHVNPYTGVAWKDEPSIISISLVNEDTIFGRATGEGPIRAMYEQKFQKWMDEKNIKPASAGARERWRNIFLVELYNRAYDRMSSFVRKLGSRAMLTDQNFWEIVPMALMRDRYDLTDTHYYWIHPTFTGKKDWELPALVPNKSAVASAGGMLAKMFPCRIYGKPLTMTEWDYVNPNRFAVEGAFLQGAYGALQGWNAMCRFTFAHYAKMATRDDQITLMFSIWNDPLRLLSERAGALFFVRGDVSESDVDFPVVINRDYMEKYHYPQREFPYYVHRLGLIGRTGSVVEKADGKTILPRNTRFVLGFRDDIGKQFPGVPGFPMDGTRNVLRDIVAQSLIPVQQLDLERERFTSSTGELSLDRKQRTFRAVTPKSEAFLLNAGQIGDGKIASVTSRDAFGAFLVAAVDGAELAKSRRVLMLHLTETKNSGAKFSDDTQSRLDSWGKLPLLMRCNRADVTLRGDWSDSKLYAVDINGERLREVPFTTDGGGIRFQLDNRDGVAVYELERTEK